MKIKKKNVFWLVIIECLVLSIIFAYFMINDSSTASAKTLEAGKYVVGENIDEGVYNVSVNSKEDFNASINVLNKEFIFMNKISPSYNNLNLVKGESFEVFYDTIKGVDFSKKNKFKSISSGDLKQGTYVVGRDISEGSYTFEIESIKGSVASIVLNNKDTIELHPEKLKSDKVDLTKDTIITISLSNIAKVSLKKAN